MDITVNIDAAVLINAVITLTLWLAAPVVLGLVCRKRWPELERTAVRCVLLSTPLVLVLALFVSPQQSALMLWPEGGVNVASLPSQRALPVRSTLEPSIPSVRRSVRFHPSVFESFEFQAVVALPVIDARWRRTAPASHSLTASPAVAAVTPGSPLSLPPTVSILVVAICWATIAAWGLLRLLAAHLALSRLRRSWRPVDQDSVRAVRALAHRLGYYSPLDVHTSKTLTGAVALGWLRPSIAIPARWWRHLRTGQLEPLLLHEIAHLEGRDPLWRSIAWLMQSLFWPHPLVHWLSRREDELCEHIADRRVLAVGTDRRGYAELLGALATRGHWDHTTPTLSLGTFGTRNHLEGRIRMILRNTSTSPRRSWVVLSGTTLGLAALLTLAVANPVIGAPCDPPSQQKKKIESPPKPKAPRATFVSLNDETAFFLASDEPTLIAKQLAEYRQMLDRANQKIASLEAKLNASTIANQQAADKYDRVHQATMDEAELRLSVRNENYDRLLALVEAGVASDTELSGAKLEIAKAQRLFEEAHAGLATDRRDDREQRFLRALQAQAEVTDKYDSLFVEQATLQAAQDQYAELLADRGGHAGAMSLRLSELMAGQQAQYHQTIGDFRTQLERLQHQLSGQGSSNPRTAERAFRRAEEALEESDQSVEHGLHEAMEQAEQLAEAYQSHLDAGLGGQQEQLERAFEQSQRQLEHQNEAIEREREQLEVHMDRQREQMEREFEMRVRDLEREQEAQQRQLETQQRQLHRQAELLEREAAEQAEVLNRGHNRQTEYLHRLLEQRGREFERWQQEVEKDRSRHEAMLREIEDQLKSQLKREAADKKKKAEAKKKAKSKAKHDRADFRSVQKSDSSPEASKALLRVLKAIKNDVESTDNEKQ